MGVSRRDLAKGAIGSIVALTLGRANSAEVAASNEQLFETAQMKGLALANRMVMAPLTRGRAGQSRTPNSLMAEYYGQRATAGLIIAEGTAISPQAYGWIGSPGIYTQAHVEGWQSVTRVIHERGGKVFLQLWHTDRVSHPDFLDGAPPVGPSAIKAAGESYTPSGKKRYVTPRAMTEQ